MVFAEPTTMLTDFVMSLAAAWFAYRLFGRKRQAGSRHWAWAMAFTAAAAALAGIYHGFRDAWAPGTLAVLDYATTISLVVASYCVLVGTSKGYARRTGQMWLARLAFVLAGFFAVLGLFKPDFIYLIIDYGVSLAVVLYLSVRRRRLPASSWLIAGVSVSIVGAMVQMARLAPAPWFNHNDLYHLIQILGLYLFYRGALLLKNA